MLQATPPFNKWKLPHVDALEIRIIRSKKTIGHWKQGPAGRHILEVSDGSHSTLFFLIMTIAHEMIHIREAELGARMDVKHGKLFHRLADQVCKLHAFDRKAF